MNETGKENNRDSFLYFDALDEILGTNPSVSSSVLIDSNDLEEPLSVAVPVKRRLQTADSRLAELRGQYGVVH